MKEENRNKNAIYPTLSNPPTFGTILLLMQLLHTYEHVDVLVYDKPQLLDTDYIVELLAYVLGYVEGRFSVVKTNIDFTHVNAFPRDERGMSIITDKDVITTSSKIYANLKSKGFNNVFLTRLSPGYNESFHRMAFNRSVIYERIKYGLNR